MHFLHRCDKIPFFGEMKNHLSVDCRRGLAEAIFAIRSCIAHPTDHALPNTFRNMNPFHKLVLLLAGFAAGDSPEDRNDRAERIRENRRLRRELNSTYDNRHERSERHDTAQRRLLRRVG